MSPNSHLPPGKQSLDPVLSQAEDFESATMRKVAWLRRSAKLSILQPTTQY